MRNSRWLPFSVNFLAALGHSQLKLFFLNIFCIISYSNTIHVVQINSYSFTLSLPSRPARYSFTHFTAECLVRQLNFSSWPPRESNPERPHPTGPSYSSASALPTVLTLLTGEQWIWITVWFWLYMYIVVQKSRIQNKLATPGIEPGTPASYSSALPTELIC